MDFIDFITGVPNSTAKHLLSGYILITVAVCYCLSTVSWSISLPQLSIFVLFFSPKIINHVYRSTSEEKKLKKEIIRLEQQLKELESSDEDDESTRQFVEYQKIKAKSNRLHLSLENKGIY